MLVIKCDYCEKEMTKAGRSLDHIKREHDHNHYFAHGNSLGGKRSQPRFEVRVDSHYNTKPTKYIFCCVECLSKAVEQWTTL